MLTRYQIVRGKRPPGNPLPAGTRIDVRKHTRHVLAPEPAMVEALLADALDPTRRARFERAYLGLLARRVRARRAEFDALAEQARGAVVYLGCSCPTKRQPEVACCHTVLALRFMRARYPDLDVRVPGDPDAARAVSASRRSATARSNQRRIARRGHGKP